MTLLSLQSMWSNLQQIVAKNIVKMTGDIPSFILFVSFTDSKQRAKTFTITASNFKDCWHAAFEKLQQIVKHEQCAVRWLRVDWVESVEAVSWKQLQARLKLIKRNYFRYGLSLDSRFTNAFLETEINANAMLYGGPKIINAVVNESNFIRYAKLRHKCETVDFAEDAIIYQFSTQAAFISDDAEEVYLIDGAGRNAGRRIIEHMRVEDVHALVERGSHFLTTQVQSNGRFIYGWHPCFDREISAYNTLRHASSLYSMIEAWEITGDIELKAAIDRGLEYLTGTLIKTVSHNNQQLAFLLDEKDEIKLGGNAVCLLALVKYSEVTGTEHYLPLLEKLAAGIVFMQDQQTGKFRHVLNYSSLKVKQEFRIIYYDGEAAFGLMRLYALNRDERWINTVEKAFVHFIAADHWKAHDHWLAYAVNELTRYRPRPEYFDFGVKNFIDYLDFIAERITTFPTLLELMMAAQQMLARLETEPSFSKILEQVDQAKFYKALEKRAHYLLNGHFWPELAMFYAKPQKIDGSFFIRHHAFRVRIDDVEHYLSGLVAYLKYRKNQAINVPFAVLSNERPQLDEVE